jgi:hypothetical protein
MNVKTWEPYIGLTIIETKMCKTRWFLHDHIEGFAFNLKELGWLKGQEVQIIMEDENLIFKCGESMERALVRDWGLEFQYMLV